MGSTMPHACVTRLFTRSKQLTSCRLCLHVVVVVGLECFHDLLDDAVEPLMPDRVKVNQGGHGGSRRACVVKVRYWDVQANQ